MRTSLLAASLLWLASGCATVTGTVTGAFTGAVDLPAETYRANCEEFHDNPILYGMDALVMGPVGLVLGPVMGFFKGASLDVQWVVGHVDYDEVFGTYGRESIWRPHTIYWPIEAVCLEEPPIIEEDLTYGEALYEERGTR